MIKKVFRSIAGDKLTDFIKEELEILKIKYLLNKTKDKNINFIWIPKTAGSSMYAWLNKEIDMVKLHRKKRIKAFSNYGTVTFSHYSYKSLLQHNIINSEFHKNSYKFAIIRNPYERANSLFKYLRKMGFHDCNKFNDFLNLCINPEDIGFYNVKNLSQTNKQVDWLFNNGKLICDDIFKIEEQDKIIKALESVSGKKIQSKIPFHNVTDKSDVNKLSISSKDKQLIESIWSKDFDFYETYRSI